MPGQSLMINLALLLRRDVALEPDEAALGRQPLAQFRRVEIGQVGGEQFGRLVDVDEPARLGIERRHAHIGRQHFAVAIEDVGPRGGDGVAGNDAMRGVAVGSDREHHEPRGDDGIDGGEGQDRQADPRPRLGAAVDIAAVEQFADEPVPPMLFAQPRIGRTLFRRRRLKIFRGYAHRGAPLGASGAGAGGMLPVVSIVSDCSQFSMMPPIGSLLSAVVSCGGRSGR